MIEIEAHAVYKWLAWMIVCIMPFKASQFPIRVKGSGLVINDVGYLLMATNVTWNLSTEQLRSIEA